MNTNIDRIRDALQFMPVGGHDERLRVAFMLKAELGDTGRVLWDDWRGERGNDEAEPVWRSVSAEGRLKIGTLFHEAKAHGWRDDRPHQKPTPEDLSERQRKAADKAAKEEAAIVRDRARAASMAAAILKAATEARADHPYCARKQVSPDMSLREIWVTTAAQIMGYPPQSGGEMLSGRLLVVPVRREGKLVTLELIDGRGNKAALPGRGTKREAFWTNDPLMYSEDGPEPLRICEGLATALSVREACGGIVIAALSAGNLQAVGRLMRERYPTRPLIFCADLIKATGEPDPHAIEAARSVGGTLAIPYFGTDRAPNLTDFNDMSLIYGAESVGRAIAGASAPAIGEPQLNEKNAPEMGYARDVNLIRGSDVTPEAINWLWDGWLAAGKMHIFGGAPGTGKTTIAMGLAATVTTGGRWPDGTRSTAGNVVIWSGEDDPADTLIPRLALSGADLSRVYFIGDIREGIDQRSFDPARDMEPLRRKLTDIGGAKMLIVDPIVSAIAGDSHKNAEVRRGLQPLADLAAAMRCALLGITHFSKGTGGRDPVERLTGSLAFGALARVVLVAAKHQEESEDGRTVRLFCRAKSNIGPDDGGFEYDLHQAELQTHPGIFASAVLWGDAVEGEARELLATADATGDDGEGGSLSDAKRFLADLLENGPMRAGEVFKDADQAGYSKRSIQRAANTINVERHKDGMKGGWSWQLPPKVPSTPKVP